MSNASFRIKKNGRAIRNAVFNSYETARGEIRKRIRKAEKNTPSDVKWAMGWDTVARNPVSIKEYGYSIERVLAA